MRNSEDLNPAQILQILHDLQQSSGLSEARFEALRLDPRLELLRRWQSERLRRTYLDLLDNPEYGSACQFFLSDVYAPKDLSQRDHELEALHDLLSRLLPEVMLSLLTTAITVNKMTNQLDLALLDVLVSSESWQGEITEQRYVSAYRTCNNLEERQQQIDLLAMVLQEVGKGASLPLVGFTLRVSKVPAQRAGWQVLYDFLLRGYHAFKPMHKVGEFVETIHFREHRILAAIYSGEPDPLNAWW
jgi:hypothetical protein